MELKLSILASVGLGPGGEDNGEGGEDSSGRGEGSVEGGQWRGRTVEREE